MITLTVAEYLPEGWALLPGALSLPRPLPLRHYGRTVGKLVAVEQDHRDPRLIYLTLEVDDPETADEFGSRIVGALSAGGGASV